MYGVGPGSGSGSSRAVLVTARAASASAIPDIRVSLPDPPAASRFLDGAAAHRHDQAQGDVVMGTPLAPVLTLDEQRAAERLLRQAAAEGRFSDTELSHRLGLVYKATTPHELWKAT